MTADQLDPHFRQILKESTNQAQWDVLVEQLKRELEGRISVLPDSELPSIKYKILYLLELKNLFQSIHGQGK